MTSEDIMLDAFCEELEKLGFDFAAAQKSISGLANATGALKASNQSLAKGVASGFKKVADARSDVLKGALGKLTKGRALPTVAPKIKPVTMGDATKVLNGKANAGFVAGKSKTQVLGGTAHKGATNSTDWGQGLLDDVFGKAASVGHAAVDIAGLGILAAPSLKHDMKESTKRKYEIAGLGTLAAGVAHEHRKDFLDAGKKLLKKVASQKTAGISVKGGNWRGLMANIVGAPAKTVAENVKAALPKAMPTPGAQMQRATQLAGQTAKGGHEVVKAKAALPLATPGAKKIAPGVGGHAFKADPKRVIDDVPGWT